MTRDRDPAGQGASRDGWDAELAPAVDVPVDTHLHTDLSSDSRVPIDVYAAAAAERGIPELAITDHLDFDPRAPNFAFADYARRERVVREAAERWADRVALRLGEEVSYEARHEESIREYLAGHQYDFVIGSVHVHSYSPWNGPRLDASMGDRDLAEAVAPYFAEVAAAAQSGLFDTIGHVDYIRKYVARYTSRTDFAGLVDMYEPTLKTIARAGIGLEVNTSGLRHVTRDTYPPQWAVQRFADLGGERITVGSDAHAAEQFGFGLGRAYRFAAAAGFDTVAIRRGSEAVRLPIPPRFLDQRSRIARTTDGGPPIISRGAPPDA